MLAYLVTNLATGSKYIGITKFSLRERWSGHRSSARPGGPSTPIARALRKYGEAAFRIEVIANATPGYTNTSTSSRVK
jgi:hypothetical protein